MRTSTYGEFDDWGLMADEEAYDLALIYFLIGPKFLLYTALFFILQSVEMIQKMIDAPVLRKSLD